METAKWMTSFSRFRVLSQRHVRDIMFVKKAVATQSLSILFEEEPLFLSLTPLVAPTMHWQFESLVLQIDLPRGCRPSCQWSTRN
eukprot:scaffold692_cov118-Cylindrotheca_fusiformis.AAC.16